MPSASLRYCTQPGCKELVIKGRCKAHESARHKEIDRRRKGKDHRAVYQTVAWKRLREVVLSVEPWCRACKCEWAKEVDHIAPISAGGAAFELENLQPLCHACHSAKTMSEMNSGITRGV